MTKSVFDKTQVAEAVAQDTATVQVTAKPYEAVAFLNVTAEVDIEVDGEVTTVAYKPVGAKFTRKWANDPKNQALWEALQLVDDPHKIFECDYRLVKGDELTRADMEKLLDTLDDELKALLQATTSLSSSEDYTRYVKVVGDLYSVTKSGKRHKVPGVFPPSFDFKVGLEGKKIREQIHLISAVIQNKPIRWVCTSFEDAVADQGDEVTSQDYM